MLLPIYLGFIKKKLNSNKKGLNARVSHWTQVWTRPVWNMNLLWPNLIFTFAAEEKAITPQHHAATSMLHTEYLSRVLCNVWFPNYCQLPCRPKVQLWSHVSRALHPHVSFDLYMVCVKAEKLSFLCFLTIGLLSLLYIEVFLGYCTILPYFPISLEINLLNIKKFPCTSVKRDRSSPEQSAMACPGCCVLFGAESFPVRWWAHL